MRLRTVAALLMVRTAAAGCDEDVLAVGMACITVFAQLQSGQVNAASKGQVCDAGGCKNALDKQAASCAAQPDNQAAAMIQQAVKTACQTDIDGMMGKLQNCADPNIAGDMVAACGPAQGANPSEAAVLDKICSQACQDFQAQKNTCLLGVLGDEGVGQMKTNSLMCDCKKEDGSYDCGCGELMNLPADMNAACGDLTNFKPTAASMDKVCGSACQSFLAAKKGCLAGILGAADAHAMVQTSEMCAPCPRAVAMVPSDTDGKCDSDEKTMEGQQAAVLKPECKDYFCGIMNACPETPAQSPVPGMPQEQYVAYIKNIKDNVGTCPQVSRSSGIEDVSATTSYSAAFALMASIGAAANVVA